MPGRFSDTRVMLCWPSDRTDIRRLAAIGQTEAFKPTVEHSLSTCDSCDRSIWIAPQQLQLVRSPLLKAKKLCMFCVSTVQRTLNLNPHEVDIGLNMRGARRRTT